MATNGLYLNCDEEEWLFYSFNLRRKPAPSKPFLPSQAYQRRGFFIFNFFGDSFLKYTIHGFQHQAIMNLGLTHDECLVLRWFVDFKKTEMKEYIKDGIVYYWVNYQTVLNDLAVLRLKKQRISILFKRLVNAGVLKHFHLKEGGSYSFYALGEFYTSLTPPPTKKIADPYVKNYAPIEPVKEESKPPKEEKPKASKKATRLPDDWKPSDKLIEWVIEKQKEKKITLDIPDVTFEFCNYWHSKAGANVTKMDWDKTFQNWIIRQFQYAPKYKQPEKPTAQKPADYYDTSKNKYFIERD